MRSRTQRFLPATSGHTFRLELSLDFPGPVSGEKARQATRRLLESLRVEAAEAALGLQGCRLVCHDLRQIITLLPPSARPDDRAD